MCPFFEGKVPFLIRALFLLCSPHFWGASTALVHTRAQGSEFTILVILACAMWESKSYPFIKNGKWPFKNVWGATRIECNDFWKTFSGRKYWFIITSFRYLSFALKTKLCLQDDSETLMGGQQHQLIPFTPASTGQPSTLFTPSTAYVSQASDLSITSQSKEDAHEICTPKNKLNNFLAARDVSPIRTSMKVSWDEASGRTKRHYLRKAKQVVFATLEEMAPNNSEMLFRAMKEKQLDGDESTDSTLLEALAACYENASHWSSRRQILSIFADKVSFKTIKQWLPNISRYRYNIARHHLLLHGRDIDPSPKKQTRIRVPVDKLDHFLAFIMSARVIQDIPFGEKTLKLSTTKIKI